MTTIRADKFDRIIEQGYGINGTQYFDTYTYDLLGNRKTSQTSLDKTRGVFSSRTDCDYAGRAIKETNALGQYSSTVYDALGNKTKFTDYKGNVTEYSYDVLGRLIIAREQDNLLQYYLFNAHGDVVQRTDHYGGVLKGYDYDAFGVEKSPENLDSNPFRFCGEYWDSDTETLYLRNRYYDPSIGRFGAEDPINDGLNWYCYCENDPVMNVDPSGLSLTSLISAALTVVAKATSTSVAKAVSTSIKNTSSSSISSSSSSKAHANPNF